MSSTLQENAPEVVIELELGKSAEDLKQISSKQWKWWNALAIAASSNNYCKLPLKLALNGFESIFDEQKPQPKKLRQSSQHSTRAMVT